MEANTRRGGRLKVTKEMVEYWYGSDTILPKEVVKNIVDIANGDYDVVTLKTDIKLSWKGKS